MFAEVVGKLWRTIRRQTITFIKLTGRKLLWPFITQNTTSESFRVPELTQLNVFTTFFYGKVVDDFKKTAFRNIFNKATLRDFLGIQTCLNFCSPCFYNYGWNPGNLAFPLTITRHQENVAMFSAFVLNSLKDIQECQVKNNL